MSVSDQPPPEFYDEMARACKCCSICTNTPCDGVCAGGVCDMWTCRCFDDEDTPTEDDYYHDVWDDE